MQDIWLLIKEPKSGEEILPSGVSPLPFALVCILFSRLGNAKLEKAEPPV